MEASYGSRIEAELRNYRDCPNVHDLPEIFHYWSNLHLRSKFVHFGYENINHVFVSYLTSLCVRTPGLKNTFASVGAGNCELEAALAKSLVDSGIRNFSLECLELNPAMLGRGAELARTQGLADQLIFTEGDFNAWRPANNYDAIIAHHSLHHVLNLEGLFKDIKSSLKPGGWFMTSDMIGRNGHMRWPEALNIIHEIWQELPDPYKYNHQLRRQEDVFENWDCSGESFEGIRAQDILPLLVEHFSFDLFVPFGNIIDPFIDRGFGHNFNPAGEWDRSFIDRVHARDDFEMQRGNIKPTHLVAVMIADRRGRELCLPGLTPRFCVRDPLKA
jgi:SAM-dependent methyltransferase